MQRRQHEMARKRGLHGNLRGFKVTDFADHHDIGILAQDCAQAACERHLDLGVDLGLAHAVDVVLDRILDRHDIATQVVEAQQRCI